MSTELQPPSPLKRKRKISPQVMTKRRAGGRDLMLVNSADNSKSHTNNNFLYVHGQRVVEEDTQSNTPPPCTPTLTSWSLSGGMQFPQIVTPNQMQSAGSPMLSPLSIYNTIRPIPDSSNGNRGSNNKKSFAPAPTPMKSRFQSIRAGTNSMAHSPEFSSFSGSNNYASGLPNSPKKARGTERRHRLPTETPLRVSKRSMLSPIKSSMKDPSFRRIFLSPAIYGNSQPLPTPNSFHASSDNHNISTTVTTNNKLNHSGHDSNNLQVSSDDINIHNNTTIVSTGSDESNDSGYSDSSCSPRASPPHHQQSLTPSLKNLFRSPSYEIDSVASSPTGSISPEPSTADPNSSNLSVDSYSASRSDGVDSSPFSSFNATHSSLVDDEDDDDDDDCPSADMMQGQRLDYSDALDDDDLSSSGTFLRNDDKENEGSALTLNKIIDNSELRAATINSTSNTTPTHHYHATESHTQLSSVSKSTPASCLYPVQEKDGSCGMDDLTNTATSHNTSLQKCTDNILSFPTHFLELVDSPHHPDNKTVNHGLNTSKSSWRVDGNDFPALPTVGSGQRHARFGNSARKLRAGDGRTPCKRPSSHRKSCDPSGVLNFNSVSISNNNTPDGSQMSNNPSSSHESPDILLSTSLPVHDLAGSRQGSEIAALANNTGMPNGSTGIDDSEVATILNFDSSPSSVHHSSATASVSSAPRETETSPAPLASPSSSSSSEALSSSAYTASPAGEKININPNFKVRSIDLNALSAKTASKPSPNSTDFITPTNAAMAMGANPFPSLSHHPMLPSPPAPPAPSSDKGGASPSSNEDLATPVGRDGGVDFFENWSNMHTRGVRGMGCGLVTLTEENATGTDFASTKPRRSRTLGHLHELEVDEACGTKTGHTIGCAHAHEDCVHGTRRERSHSLESSSSSSSSSSENHLHDDASYKSDSDLSQSQSISSAIRAIRIDNDNDDEYDIEMDNGECGEGTGHDSSGISFDLHMPTMPKYGSTCARHHRSLSLCGSTSCHSSSLSSSSSSSSSTSELHFESPELDSVFEIEDPPKMSSVPSNDSMIMDGHNDVTTPVNNGGSRKKTLGYDYENDESTDAFMLLSPDPSAFEGSESLQRKAIQPINYNKRCPATPERLRRPNRLIRHSSLFDNKLLISFGDMNFTGTIFERDFTDRQIVGEGAFFECYRVADADTGIVYAVKKSKRSFRGKKDRQNYLKEVKLLHALGGHPNIVRVYRAWQQELHFFVQMEHCDGNLSGFVSRLQGHISDRFLITCCAQICQALAHIHRANLIHLDVKPANVLVVLPKDREGRIKCSPGPDRFFDFTLKLTDFGQAILKKEQKDAVEGDSQYMAPELLAIDYTPTSAADIFSLGLLLLEIATGLELPLTGSKWHDLREGKAGEYLSGSITSPNLQAVIESMLHPDPSQRPTALRIIEQLKYLAPSGSRTMNTPSPFGRRSSSM